MSSNMRTFRDAFGTVLVVALMSVMGAGHAATMLRLSEKSFLDLDAQLPQAKGHPNEEFRIHGLKSHLSGRDDDAVEYFKRAARHADKASQHYLSMMYWYGQGVPIDRVEGYVWSDLAAERGSRRMLIIRERMWRELSEAERAQVSSRGVTLYAEYGDVVAKPRAERALRKFANNKTGSRVGYNDQSLGIQFGGPIHGSFGNATAGMMSASAMVNGGSNGQTMYGDERTRSDPYWSSQDRALEGEIKVTIDVGPIEDATRKTPD